MAPLPPPPPAPPPPPPGLGAPLSASVPKLGKSQATDRNALLSQIRSGAKLKRTTQINDRSAPIVDGARKASGNNSSQNSTTGNSVNSVQMQLEGLFSGGMPRLKPTGSKPATNNDRPMNTTSDRGVRPVSGVREIPKQPMNQYRSDNQQSIVATSSIKASLEQQFNQQNRQQLSTRTDSGMNSTKKFNTVHSNKVRRSNTSFPSDVNIGSGKGPAPSVPSINKSGPPLPSKPPTVQRSNSQSVNKTKTNTVRTGPPNVKPPPPPKAKEQCFPNPQLKPTVNVNRRQSFGGNDSHTMNFTETSQPPLPPAPPPPVNNLKPPPPPRNNSMPNGLSNHTPQSGVNSRTAPIAAVSPMPHTPKMNHTSPRPALGPPPPPPPHRTGSTRNDNSSSGLSSYPPPPPPSSSMPTKSNSVQPFQAPPPPVRHTSISKTDLESRFSSFFKGIQLLPAPDKFIGTNKLYPSSAAAQQKRRVPPPPPPPPSLSALPHAISPQLNAHHNSNITKSNNCLRQPSLFVHLEPRLYPPGVGPGVAQC